jgi:hypothetical protein
MDAAPEWSMDDGGSGERKNAPCRNLHDELAWAVTAIGTPPVPRVLRSLQCGNLG